MERKEFLQRMGLTSVLIPVLQSCSSQDPEPDTSSTNGTNNSGSSTCAVTDTETDGPYPLYNSRGSSINRVDITDGKEGTALNMTLTVLNVNDSCKAVENARVDIWHCDKDGYYSGYTNQGYLGTQNNSSKVFCRGLQYSDGNGQVMFTTIYPGWYTGRVTHIHVQVYVNNVLKLTSQIAFPEDINTAIYDSSAYSAHGQNSTKNTSDGIIKDSLDNELAVVTANSSGGYDLTHSVYVSA